jgi:small basic protein
LSKDDITKLVATALTLPIVFFLLGYAYEDIDQSITAFLSLFMFSALGCAIGGLYAYYAHNLFFKNSLFTGLIPSVALMYIAIKMDIGNLVVLGDLCLIISCWVIASKLAFIKNKSIK